MRIVPWDEILEPSKDEEKLSKRQRRIEEPREEDERVFECNCLIHTRGKRR